MIVVAVIVICMAVDLASAFIVDKRVFLIIGVLLVSLLKLSITLFLNCLVFDGLKPQLAKVDLRRLTLFLGELNLLQHFLFSDYIGNLLYRFFLHD